MQHQTYIWKDSSFCYQTPSRLADMKFFLALFSVLVALAFTNAQDPNKNTNTNTNDIKIDG